MTVELPANSLLQRSSRSGRLLMVPGIGPHQHGHLLFEAHINQICGWEITALDEQSFLQYAKNAKAKCLNIICYWFFFSVLSLSTENRFGFLDCGKKQKKRLDKYNVRLCCVSGSFEARVFLLCFSAQSGRCECCCRHFVPYGYLFG